MNLRHFDIDRIYDLYSAMDRHQRKRVIERLRTKGIDLLDIQCYVYKEAPGIKHLFFRFKDKSEAIPYFMLSEEQLSTIQEVINSISR
ncbi:MAG: hypothetical protein LUI04_03735 [Porphyromonadaceae bacterium]|nr:hypothetical protein [Porphyromonadaceae bacterium]